MNLEAAIGFVLIALAVTYIVWPRGRRCDGCGQRESYGRLIGAWWHLDGCPNLRPQYPTDGDE